MEPENFKFGGGAAQTVLHPLVLLAMLITIVMIVLLPRKYLIVYFILSTFLIPAGQQFYVAGVHVFISRIIIVAGLLRLFRGRDASQPFLIAGGWNSVDTAFLLSVGFHALAFSLYYLQTAAVVNQFGYIWDFVGSYFLLRYAIQDEKDIVRAIKCFVILSVIFAVCMIREQITDQNIFGLLGGVKLVSDIREGHIRSGAVFQHSILAGSFGAISLPLFIILWKSARAKLMAAAGVVSSAVMTLTAFSSTSLIGWVAGILAIFLWPFRKRMRWFRWGIVLGLFALNLVMKAPVWFLIDHVGTVAGSSSSHRAHLVDSFIRHAGDWWLLGTDKNNNWGYFMFDTSNQFVEEGVSGGLIALIFFIATITWSFGRLGKARKVVEGDDSKAEWFLWLLGCSLFANVVVFFGIYYFDQTRVAWFALLAMISAATAPLLRAGVLPAMSQPDAISADSQLAYSRLSSRKTHFNSYRGSEKKQFDSGTISVERK